MCSLLSSVPPGVDICTLLLLLLCACVCVRVYVCARACSDTPPGERVCHDKSKEKNTLKKVQPQSLNYKKKAFACAFLVDIPRQGEKTLEFRRHLNPKPQTLK
jgi:hypothetical protein